MTGTTRMEKPYCELRNDAVRILMGEQGFEDVGIKGDEIRSRVNALLRKGKGEHDRTINVTKELTARLLPDLIVQYDEWARDTRGDKPSLAQVLNSFTVEKLEIADSYKIPYLLMLPVKEEGSDKIIGYQPIIVEGIQEKESCPDDDRNASLGDRIKARKNQRRPGEEGIDKPIYHLLYEAAEKAGKPIDFSSYTMLDDFTEGTHQVPCAITFGGRKMIYHFSLSWPYPPTGFRSTVSGNVLNI